MVIYSLASGSKGNCFIIKLGGKMVMIDCGSTKKYLMECLMALHIEISDIDFMLVTHNHVDHISQIKSFKSLPIYASNDINDINVNKINLLEKIVVEGIKVMPIALSHDSPNTCGYILEANNERLLYMTDTGYFNERYYALLKDLDCIVIESNYDVSVLMASKRPHIVKQRALSDSGHLGNEDCLEVLKNIINHKTKCIMLAHISQETNRYEIAYETIYNGLCEAGVDVGKFELVTCKQHEIVVGGNGYE